MYDHQSVFSRIATHGSGADDADVNLIGSANQFTCQILRDSFSDDRYTTDLKQTNKQGVIAMH